MADLWVQSFDGDPDDTVRDLQAAFGLDEATARGIVENVPCVVKRNVDPVGAMPWVRALREMGARVELRDEAVRQDPRASLRMPRARFGRKSLRPSDKGTKRPDLPTAGAAIPNPLAEEPPDDAPAGSDVLDEVLGDVLAEVAQPKPVPERPSTSEVRPPPDRGPSPFPASAVVAPSPSAPPSGPAVFAPPPGATPRRVSSSPEPAAGAFDLDEAAGGEGSSSFDAGSPFDLDEAAGGEGSSSFDAGSPFDLDDAAGGERSSSFDAGSPFDLDDAPGDDDLRLDVSGELDLGPPEPAPRPVASSVASTSAVEPGPAFEATSAFDPLGASAAPADAVLPTAEPAPNAAQSGYGFGDDPLEPPIPDGMLELDVVPPPPAPDPPLVSAPAAPPPLDEGPPDVPEGLEEEAPERGRRAQLLRAAWLAGGGAIALLVAGVSGLSCFAGGVPLPFLILDALGFAGLGLGALYAVSALRGSVVEGSPIRELGALVVAFAVAAGINFLNAPSPAELQLREVVARDEETADAVAAGRYPGARVWAQAHASPAIARLIDELYTSGAAEVYAPGGGQLIVAMPELRASRASIERAYRRFLGYRVDQVEASVHPAARYWWIVVDFGD